MGKLIQNALKSANRREWLCKHVPTCPVCKEKQVQLLRWFIDPAVWKCRICKYKWSYEPQPEDL